jgi:oligopeptide transport system ATP-binding protein
MGLLGGGAEVGGSIRFGGRELLGLSRKDLDAIRGADIGMVFQDPMSSLNPYLSVGLQLAEVLIQHRGASRAAADAESARMLDAVGIDRAAQRLRQYPHEFSGGMRQRVTIAMALLCKPRLLIADEPTTALDVTVQAQILDLLDQLRASMNLALILITHDLGVVAEVCERAVVMYAGRIVEAGATRTLLRRPLHPYTQGLLASRPGLRGPRPESLHAIPGQPPNPARLPEGCAFAPRCTLRIAACDARRPCLETQQDVTRACACHLLPRA